MRRKHDDDCTEIVIRLEDSEHEWLERDIPDDVLDISVSTEMQFNYLYMAVLNAVDDINSASEPRR
jgi:hypothetical protein